VRISAWLAAIVGMILMAASLMLNEISFPEKSPEPFPMFAIGLILALVGFLIRLVYKIRESKGSDADDKSR
jgi:hypothetical protein